MAFGYGDQSGWIYPVGDQMVPDRTAAILADGLIFQAICIADQLKYNAWIIRHY